MYEAEDQDPLIAGPKFSINKPKFSGSGYIGTTTYIVMAYATMAYISMNCIVMTDISYGLLTNPHLPGQDA